MDLNEMLVKLTKLGGEILTEFIFKPWYSENPAHKKFGTMQREFSAAEVASFIGKELGWNPTWNLCVAIASSLDSSQL